MTPKQCEPNATITESKIKATSNFFDAACKAGPWVADSNEDQILKKKYPSLCHLCYSSCSTGDKYWGRRGSLYCLTSGTGNVAVARLDDVRSHFGLDGNPAQADPARYSFLCVDGHLQPLDSHTNPCVLVAKPWPVLTAKRKFAERVQLLVDKVLHDPKITWRDDFLMLLENYHVDLSNLDYATTIEDYLNEATGYQSAYSFPSCQPSRSIVYCTTSIVEHNKCSWLQEAAMVQGVEPNVQCVRSPSTYDCLKQLRHGAVDVVRVGAEERIVFSEEFTFSPFLVEFSKDIEKRLSFVAITRKGNKIGSWKELLGQSICALSAPAYASLIAVSHKFKSSVSHKGDINLRNLFASTSCLWNLNSAQSECGYHGESDSSECLQNDRDIAIISLETFRNLSNRENFEILCLPPFNKTLLDGVCHLNWLPRGYLVINNGTEQTRATEILSSFKQLDKLFGRQRESLKQFRLYDSYDGRENVLFDTRTDTLLSVAELQTVRFAQNSIETEMDVILRHMRRDEFNGSSSMEICRILLGLGLVLQIKLNYF